MDADGARTRWDRVLRGSAHRGDGGREVRGREDRDERRLRRVRQDRPLGVLGDHRHSAQTFRRVTMKATVMTRRNVRGRFVAASALLTGAMLAAGTAPLVAQSTELDPRWQAWLGCWQPARDTDAPMLVGDVNVPLTCVVPL